MSANPDYRLQPYLASDFTKLTGFIQAYLERYPDAKVYRPEFYTYHPALQNQENTLCAFDARGELAGFAPLFPVVTTDENGVTGPHDVWAILIADPRLEQGNAVREALLAGLLNKVHALKDKTGLARVRLCMEMMDSQQGDLQFLLSRGFETFEKVLVMSRDTRQPIPALPAAEAVTIRPTRLAGADEQDVYLRAYNTCFPESPKNLDDWGFLFQSELWEKGSAFVAYGPEGEFAGSILAYYDAERGCGMSDDVMVLPRWRGRGLAKNLIAEGLRHFLRLEIPRAELEVKQSNAPAVAAYTALGYRVSSQMSLLRRVV